MLIMLFLANTMSNSHGTDAIENFRSDYDTRFTTDISKQMQMPDRLGAISTIYDSYMPPLDPLKDSKMPNLGKNCSMFCKENLNRLCISRAPPSEQFILRQQMRSVNILHHL